jgi:hypothetical protein
MKQIETIDLIDFKTNKDIFVEVKLNFSHQRGVFFGDDAQEDLFSCDWETLSVKDIHGEDCLLPDYMNKKLEQEVDTIIANIEING